VRIRNGWAGIFSSRHQQEAGLQGKMLGFDTQVFILADDRMFLVNKRKLA